MAKTPPVIIPVIVDATGVDRGIQDANRRLRYGMRGGAGTSTGFGTGGGQAAGAGLGGGGLATGIAAGAVAGAVASRVRMSSLTPRQRFNRMIDNADEAGLARISASMGRFYARRTFGDFNADLPFPTAPNSIMRNLNAANNLRFAHIVSSNFLSRTGYKISTAMGNFGAGLSSRGMMGLAAGGTITGMSDLVGLGAYGLGVGQRFANRQTNRALRYAEGIQNRPITGIAGRAMSALGMGRFAALGPIGVGAGIVGAAVNFPQRLRESFSDLSQFEGTPNYNAARRIRAYYNAPERRRPGFFQEFGIGAAQVNQGGGSNIFSALGESIGGFARGIARYAGAALTNPFDFIAALGDPSSELNRRTQADQDIIVNEWKRLLY